MKLLRGMGLFGVVATSACSFNASTSNPPPQPPPYYYPPQSAAPQPYYAGGYVNPNPWGRPGVPPAPYGGQPSHPAPYGFAAEAVNVQRIASVANANPKACGWLESTPMHWVKVDCHAYTPTQRAIAHLSPRKAAVVTSGQSHWRPLGILRGAAQQRGMRVSPVAPMSNTVRGVNPTTGGVPLPPDLVRGDAAPAAVDHRVDNTEGPVKDQGPVGSCTAFSLSTTIDNQAIRLGKMQPNNGQQATSPNHVWAGYGIPQMSNAADSNLNRAIAPLSLWPQNNREACELADARFEEDCGFETHVAPGSWRTDPTLVQHKQASDSGGQYKVVQFEQLKTLPFDPAELTSTLASGNSVWIAMKIDALAFSAKSMKGGVIPDWSTPNGGHAMEMAGYRDTPQGRQYLVHNSWGVSWGEGGYGWISENMIQKFMHLAYKVKLDGAPPPQNTTDDDCSPDDIMDILSGQCTLICPDGSRPNGGCKGGSAPGQPPPNGGFVIPPLPSGFPTIPGLTPPPTK
ncbi:MAG TPA: C1 family peptidase [Labilithrix sp.]